MKKNNRVKFIQGGIIGMALGIAAGVLLTSPSGKKFRGEVKDASREFYAYLAPRIKKVKKIGEREYNEFVSNAMEKYAKMKNLSEKEKNEALSHAKKSWKHIKKHIA